MKASVWANLLEEGQEKTISDQKRPEATRKRPDKNDFRTNQGKTTNK